MNFISVSIWLNKKKLSGKKTIFLKSHRIKIATTIHISSPRIALKNKILKTILYFDVFSYPLNAEELYSHHNNEMNLLDFKFLLNELVNDNLLQTYDNFYYSTFGKKESVDRRLRANEMATNEMPEAIKWSKKIYQFPFVASVNLSGSIAKNYFDENSDIDYFIVAKKNRIWICRTLLMLYWKLLSKENKKKLCTNYFVDESSLEIIDKNQFTATELTYLIPIVNAQTALKLLNENNWVKSYIEDKTISLQHHVQLKEGRIKLVIEKLLNSKLGNRLDDYLLKLTITRWRKKFPEMEEEDFELQFRSRKNVCKRHTKGFQNKVLLAWENKIKEFESAFNVSLS